MIDLEPTIFAAHAAKFAEEAKAGPFRPVKVRAEYRGVSDDFPLCTVAETENTVYDRTRDSGSVENHAKLTFEVNVYSNHRTDKRGEARHIVTLSSNLMQGLGFTRTYCKPTPNPADPSVFRITARFEAVVDVETGDVYRR